MGSGVNNTMRYIGTAAGIPIVATLVDGIGTDGALLACTALAVLAAGGFALLSRRG
jgi:sugar phosphate permease